MRRSCDTLFMGESQSGKAHVIAIEIPKINPFRKWLHRGRPIARAEANGHFGMGLRGCAKKLTGARAQSVEIV